MAPDNWSMFNRRLMVNVISFSTDYDNQNTNTIRFVANNFYVSFELNLKQKRYKISSEKEKLFPL